MDSVALNEKFFSIIKLTKSISFSLSFFSLGVI